MNNKFNWAVALYIISFFMPVISGVGNPETTIYGWEIASEPFNFQNSSDFLNSDDWVVLVYILAIIPNPLIATVIILRYLKKDYPNLIWVISLLALICAIVPSPFFFSTFLSGFDVGYWLWLLGILLIYYYANEGSVKPPSKRKKLLTEEHTK